VVAVPAEGEAPHEVVVAAHANFDRPEWECGWWRRHFPEAFVFCPRGILRDDTEPDDPRYTYRDDAALKAELDAGLLALRAKYPGQFDDAEMIWVALSRGAYLGGFIASRQPKRFPRLILVEGGQDPWTAANAKAFVDGGGRRVLFICGQPVCRIQARPAAARLKHFGAEAKIEDVPGMGHGLNGDADPIITRHMAWLRE
jgi:pimeloyl-ACP methyl ester carboxylesterase